MSKKMGDPAVKRDEAKEKKRKQTMQQCGNDKKKKKRGDTVFFLCIRIFFVHSNFSNEFS